jgi:hypothetical protein
MHMYAQPNCFMPKAICINVKINNPNNVQVKNFYLFLIVAFFGLIRSVHADVSDQISNS